MASVTVMRQAYRRAMESGVAFLKAHQNQDGSFPPLETGLGTYYKVPLAYAARGEVAAALRLLQWVKANGMTEAGDFDGVYGRGTMAVNASYPNAWIICGAARLGMYDMALPAVRYLLTLQDPGTGGFYRARPDAAVQDDQPVGTYTGGNLPGIQDLLCASMSGLACLATGLTEAAVKAGRFLQRMLALQPAPQEKIYFRWRNGQGLMTEFPADQALAFVVDGKKEGQMYFQVGISAAFLARLSQATGNQEFLETAKSYLNATEGQAPDRYSTGRSGKVGWGAAYVYRLTGDERYGKMSLAVGEALCQMQGESGSWVEASPLPARIEVTAEFVALLNEMQEALV